MIPSSVGGRCRVCFVDYYYYYLLLARKGVTVFRHRHFSFKTVAVVGRLVLELAGRGGLSRKGEVVGTTCVANNVHVCGGWEYPRREKSYHLGWINTYQAGA